MGQTATHPILKRAIQGMNVSREFKAMAKANHYRTLSDVLKEPMQSLPFKPQSGYRMLRELLDLLKESGLDDYIEDKFE